MSRRGYTLIEVMMALALLAIGATGIFSLQAVAIHANDYARDTTEGVTVNRWWVEQIRRDALNWDGAQTPPVSLAKTQYLKLVQPVGGGTWFTPAFPNDDLLGTGAPQVPMGRELDVTPDPAQGRYCAQMRLAWLRQGRLMRAEVRVWWYKAGADRTLYPNCGAGREVAMQTDTANVHWIYLATTVEPPS